jgi:hypothetical protein
MNLLGLYQPGTERYQHGALPCRWPRWLRTSEPPHPLRRQTNLSRSMPRLAVTLRLSKDGKPL